MTLALCPLSHPVPPHPTQSFTRMSRSQYIYALVVVLVSLFEVGHCATRGKSPLELYYLPKHRGFSIVNMFLAQLRDLESCTWRTHCRFAAFKPQYAIWYIELEVVRKYFGKDGGEDELRAVVWCKVGRDRVKLKETLEKAWDKTHFYHDMVDKTLRIISQDKPSSLKIFRQWTQGGRSSGLLGTLEQDGQQEAYVQVSYEASKGEPHPTRFRRSLDLWKQVSTNGLVITHSSAASLDSSSHLSAMDIAQWDETSKTVLYPLSKKHLSYGYLASLVEPHPELSFSMEDLLKYEPKCPR